MYKKLSNFVDSKKLEEKEGNFGWKNFELCCGKISEARAGEKFLGRRNENRS
jgi:hypothetical protein